jgi:hypothetical protein
MKILFLHGWHSTPGGLKPTFLKVHGHTVLNPALPDDDFDLAVSIVQSVYNRHHPDVVVGSSRGGAVAMNIDSGDTPLVLLCPAWKTWGTTATTVKPNTTILHSRADDVVPFLHSEELVANSGLDSSALIAVGTEHRLAEPDALGKMLEVVEGAVSDGKSNAPECTSGVVINATTGKVVMRGFPATIIAQPLPSIVLLTLIVPGDRTTEGTLVKSVSRAWFEILLHIQADPDSIHQIECWKWEEIIAGAYKQEGWDSVILTPKSGDKGVDVIVEGELGQLRFLCLDQVKAYSPDHLVGPNAIREMEGVLHRERGATKGIITTKSDFTAGALKEAEHLFPRLELKPRDKLLGWLESLAKEEGGVPVDVGRKLQSCYDELGEE